ncbi:hypothetical protein YOLOSWAG_131 [Erwinia phage vB_EamM_Yoloswag]|uniref:KTSC and Metallopeptidase-like N-terminal fusion domain-containing protein n=1 Tax=Erwinia phage vB_EamM_Yoloswag TaxID=1958956 RepID=A0A1S6L355_9CAUD|nr:hypothetical protein HOR66_gp131 [Erwinia phage vB_EamM_Yoloswag]AQT28612.1 hypothetical protein YOLOSWAG_131 [Erwinia phage vB_EamM_Yoloswag]
MLLFISASARKPKRAVTIEECDWYRFEGKRAVSVENDEFEADVEYNDVYGIVNTGKNSYALLHKEDPSTSFEIDAKQARSLLGRSRPFTGTVKGTRVSSKPKGTREQSKTPTDVSQKGKQKVWHAVPGSKPENKKLTQALQTLSVDGASGIQYMARVPLPSGELYNYYEATSTFASYKSTQRAKWERDIEDHVIAKIRSWGYVVGATFLKFNDGTVHPMLIIVEE